MDTMQPFTIVLVRTSSLLEALYTMFRILVLAEKAKRYDREKQHAPSPAQEKEPVSRRMARCLMFPPRQRTR